ncbi:MAG TPA: VCBS repeat-containing protein [Pyrinomonadaceae bacterium]|nr:VCBS repeat-containing protein [Pyrinomonadaceae bacterium]
MIVPRPPLIIACALLLLGASAAHAQNKDDVRAIIELKQSCVIGGVRSGHWVEAERLTKSINTPLKLNRYTLAGPAGELTVDKITPGDCEGEWSFETSATDAEGIAIASPSWNVMPRTPRPLDRKDTTYVNLLADLLRRSGIRKPEVEINEGYKIDLDGDGKDEVVIVASHFKDGTGELSGIGRGSAPGDYAIVLVRKIVNGQARNIFIVKDVRRAANAGPLVRGYHLSAIADLNGDGVMEIVLYDAYHEGSASHVIQINGAKPVFVLECACEH